MNTSPYVKYMLVGISILLPMLFVNTIMNAIEKINLKEPQTLLYIPLVLLLVIGLGYVFAKGMQIGGQTP